VTCAATWRTRIRRCISTDETMSDHSMMLFIIWLSLRLLLLVPNCDTMFFLCSRLHFCTFVSTSCSSTAVDRMSYSRAGCTWLIWPLCKTDSSRYFPGRGYGRCPASSSSPSLNSFLPECSPRIWLNCRILASFVYWDIVGAPL
jgi:hypothetical protein